MTTSKNDDATQLPPKYSQDDLARMFAERNKSRFQFMAGKGKWHTWDGGCWRADVELRVFNAARLVAREAANDVLQLGNKKTQEAKLLASAKTVAAIVSLASHDPRMTRAFDQWDTNDFELNTPAGIVNLRDGTIRAHSNDDFVTKITAVGPDNSVSIEKWLQFLDEISDGDRELVDYLQRVLGYALTGDIREHALFFAHGGGGNGKGVFFKTVTEIMGSYHRTAAIETFTVQKFARHTTELAALHGARLITASETEEGERWAEARIKQLTAGDEIEARFMRQDSFEFIPKFKLLISGNHKPALRSVDAAIRRRMNLIPFIVEIEKRKTVNKSLLEELKPEWPGILAWMIEGTRHWLDNGLMPPAAVI